MIRFEWPWMAALLPLPLLTYRLLKRVEARGSALYVPLAATVADAEDAGPGRRPWRRALYALIWVLLIAAAMRPQWLGSPVPISTSGRRLLLAVDVSGSMAIQDMAGGVSRLQVVQQVAGRFIDERKGDRVGLILFGTRPYLQAPLTTDLRTVHQFLDDAVVGVAGTETAIGDAIGLAIKRLRAARVAAANAGASGATGASPDDVNPADASPSDPSSAADAAAGSVDPLGQTVLILLTDGQNDAGVMPPLEAARMAAQTGLRIYTIGVGAAAGTGPYGPSSGNTDLDEGTLRAIARITGGEYFRATDGAALEEIYQRIDELEPTRGRAQWLRPRTEWFGWPLAAALLLSIPAAILGGRAWA